MRDSPKGDAHSAPAHYAGDPTSLLEVTAPETDEPVEPHDGETHSRAEIWRSTVALTLIGLAASATMIVLPLYVVHAMHGSCIDVSIMLGLGAFLEIPIFNASRVGSILSGVLSGALVAALGYRGTFLVCGTLVLFANPPFRLWAIGALDWWKARRKTA